VEGNKTAGIEN